MNCQKTNIQFMKKCLNLGIALCIAFGVFAQNDDYKSTLHLGAGFSILGGIISLADNADLAEINADLNSDEISNIEGRFMGNSAPALQVSYDYGLAKWFSLGAGVSYQRMSAAFTNFSYTNNETNQTNDVGDLNVDINRIQVGLRALFHYGNANKIDMYSGLRVGIVNSGTKIEVSNPDVRDDFESIPFLGVRPSIQLIPFALRGYVTDNIGISFETAIGAPHFFALGVNYRM